jgi:predicted MFS family arabinose efflux permease
MRTKLTVLAVLALGTFAIGTDAQIVVGLLDRIAADFAISSAQAGQLVTVFGLCYALFAPISGWLAGGIDRKRSIELASLAFIVGNIVCYLAGTYPVMVLGRVVAALGASLFTPLAFTIATSLLDEARRGAALSVVFGGMTIALIVGVPAGAYLGQRIDWHLVFLIIAAAGAIELLLLNVLLPAMPPGGRTTLWERLSPAKDPAVLTTLSITFVGVLSDYSLYTYISVVFAGAEMPARSILPSVLFAFGLGALSGNLLSGVATDTLGPRRTLLGALGVQTLALPTLFLVRQVPVAALGVTFVWGVVSYIYLIPIQHKLLALAKMAGQMTLSLNSSAIYFGIACGGALGGLALAKFGVAGLPILATAFGVVALLVTLCWC